MLSEVPVTLAGIPGAAVAVETDKGVAESNVLNQPCGRIQRRLDPMLYDFSYNSR